MKVLLLSMPDIYQSWDESHIIGPWLGGASIAANVNRKKHQVYVGDLVLKRRDVRGAIDEAVNLIQPHFVGLSAMTFQYPTALRIAEYIKENFSLPIGLGGYHITGGRFAAERRKEIDLFKETLKECDGKIDYLFYGEGEHSFSHFLDVLESRQLEDLEKITGISYKYNGRWIHPQRHNSISKTHGLESINLPDRDSRIWEGYHFYGESFDTVSTSRGCDNNCDICSIKAMYPGAGYSAWRINRVIQDIKNAKARGIQAIFFTDDNPANDPKHFKSLLREIKHNNLNDLTYSGTVSTKTMSDSETTRLMGQIGWKFAFLGVESTDQVNLKGMNKPSDENKARMAIDNLNKEGITVLAGIVVGNPDDTEVTIRRNYEWFRKHPVDSVLPQYLTPYPSTKSRERGLREGLIVNPGGIKENGYGGWSTYNGEFAHCRTRSGLEPEQIETIILEESRRFSLRRMGRLLTRKVNFAKNYPNHFRHRLRTEISPVLLRTVREVGMSSAKKARRERERKIAMNQFNI